MTHDEDGELAPADEELADRLERVRRQVKNIVAEEIRYNTLCVSLLDSDIKTKAKDILAKEFGLEMTEKE